MTFTPRRDSKGLRIRKIRFDEHGVTRRTPTDPLLAVIPFRGIHPSGLGLVLPRDLLSWAFTSR
jgi:hypothetical protein